MNSIKILAPLISSEIYGSSELGSILANSMYYILTGDEDVTIRSNMEQLYPNNDQWLESVNQCSNKYTSCKLKGIFYDNGRFPNDGQEINMNLGSNDNDVIDISRKKDILYAKCHKRIEYFAYLCQPKLFKELMINGVYKSMNPYSFLFGTRLWPDLRNALVMGNYEIENILYLIKGCVAIIDYGSRHVIINGNYSSKELSIESFKKECMDIVLNHGKSCNYTLWDYIKDYRQEFTYQGVTYIPGEVSHNIINRFTGYKGKLCDNFNVEDIQLILDHIHNIMCNSDKDMYEYLIKWMAYVIQRSDKPRTSILNIGSQGVGKTIIWQWFGKEIIGSTNFCMQDTLDSACSQFNGTMENKRFVLINEVKGSDKQDHEKMKNYICEDTVKIEKKGIDAIHQQSSHCIVMTSNHSDHHFIEETDRRYVIIKCNRDIPSQEYFATLIETLGKSSNLFYTYLKTMDLTDFNPSIIPFSQLKDDLIQSNKNSVIDFIEQFPWTDYKLAKDVYNEYLLWHGPNPIKYNKFKIKAEDRILSKEIKKKVHWMIDTTKL